MGGTAYFAACRAELLDIVCYAGILPAFGRCRFQNRFTYFLGFQRITECGRTRFTAFQALEKVGHLVDEGMLVTDPQAGNPPFIHVGLVAVGYVNGPPSPYIGFVAVIEKLQAVQIMQVPADRSMLAIYFKRIQCLVSAGISGRLKKSQRPV